MADIKDFLSNSNFLIEEFGINILDNNKIRVIIDININRNDWINKINFNYNESNSNENKNSSNNTENNELENHCSNCNVCDSVDNNNCGANDNFKNDNERIMSNLDQETFDLLKEIEEEIKKQNG